MCVCWGRYNRYHRLHNENMVPDDSNAQIYKSARMHIKFVGIPVHLYVSCLLNLFVWGLSKNSTKLSGHVVIPFLYRAASLLLSLPWPNSPADWCRHIARYLLLKLYMYILASAMSYINLNHGSHTSMCSIEYYCGHWKLFCWNEKFSPCSQNLFDIQKSFNPFWDTKRELRRK